MINHEANYLEGIEVQAMIDEVKDSSVSKHDRYLTLETLFQLPDAITDDYYYQLEELIA